MNASPNSPSSPAPFSKPWRLARWCLLGLALCATLVGLFYTIENWRGKRAWEARRHELQAEGEGIDWAAYIPSEVPDEQNFYAAPHMREWFVKPDFAIGGPDPLNTPDPFALPSRKDVRLIIGEIKLLKPEQSSEGQAENTVLKLGEPASREKTGQQIREALGSYLSAAKGGLIFAQPLQQFKPLRWVLLAENSSKREELAALFPTNVCEIKGQLPDEFGRLEIEPVGENLFRVALKGPVFGAADYLAWTDQLTPNFEVVRKALERPYARIHCDYQVPFAISIPNFVRIRTLAQTLSQRAQSHLLLNQPEAAIDELTLVHDICRLLTAKPPGKPITLVGAMITVAVSGLYTGIIHDGFLLHAWREPQLAELDAQLRKTDLLQPVLQAFREERAATCRTFETTPRSELVKVFNVGKAAELGLRFMPRGWYYQNMASGAALEQEMLESVDLKNRLVHPSRISVLTTKLSFDSGRRSPYSFLAAIALPNFVKAMQTAVRNQTVANEAQVACALERYRLARGEYPETLQGLAAQVSLEFPHDLVGGSALHYNRQGHGYLLYSVGWNEKDNNGDEGADWVWQIR